MTINKSNRPFLLTGAGLLLLCAIAFIVSVYSGEDFGEVERHASGTMAAAKITEWQGLRRDISQASWFDNANWDNSVPNERVRTFISIGSSIGRFDLEIPPPAGPDTAKTGDLIVRSGGRATFASMPGPGILIVHELCSIQPQGEINLGSGTLISRGDFVLDQGARFDGGSGVILFSGEIWDSKSSASFFAGLSKAVFNGNARQTISGEISYYNLEVLATDTVVIEGQVTVTNEFNVGEGSVVLIGPNGSLNVTGISRNDGIVTKGTAASAAALTGAPSPSLQSVIPQSLELKPNFPNPFNPSTVIEFSVPVTDRASLRVYDIQGREVRTLFEETADAKRTYRITFDATGLSSGTYVYLLQSGGMRKAGKMIFQK